MREPQVDIGPMTPGDLDGVVALERTLFTDPWARAVFEQELGDPARSSTLLGRMGDEMVGYAVAWFVRAELHVGNVAVVPSRQRRGIGGMLLRRLMSEGAGRGCVRATLEVRVSNTAAISLYRRHGFHPVALRRGYYRDNGEDALIMMADLRAAAGVPETGSSRGRGVDVRRERT